MLVVVDAHDEEERGVPPVDALCARASDKSDQIEGQASIQRNGGHLVVAIFQERALEIDRNSERERKTSGQAHLVLRARQAFANDFTLDERAASHQHPSVREQGSSCRHLERNSLLDCEPVVVSARKQPAGSDRGDVLVHHRAHSLGQARLALLVDLQGDSVPVTTIIAFRIEQAYHENELDHHCDSRLGWILSTPSQGNPCSLADFDL